MRLFLTGRNRAPSVSVAMSSPIQILLDRALRGRVDGNETDLVALAHDAKMQDTLAAVQVLDPEAAELLAADAVIEQGGENGAVTHPLERFGGRRVKQFASLTVAKRRGGTFVAIGHRALDTIDRIAGNGIALAKVIEQRRQCRELAPDRGGLQCAPFHVAAPVDDMGSDNRAQFAVIVQSGIGNKLAHIGFVGALGFAIGDIGQPFLLGRHIGQALELLARQRLFLDRNQNPFSPRALNTIMELSC